MKSKLFIFLSLFAYITQAQPKHLSPNIVWVMIDDASFRLIEPNQPTFVSSPGIDSIIQNGATVTMFCNQAYCNPSRCSMLTGVYPHDHGATDNTTPSDSRFVFFTSVLKSYGYEVSFVGKLTNTIAKVPQPEASRWWCSKVDKYGNCPFYDLNGKKHTSPDNSDQIIADTVLSWLPKLKPPFLLYIGELAPHKPPTPTPANDGIYKGTKKHPIKLPSNFYRYTKDFPSFLYQDPEKYYELSDSTSLETTIQKNYECEKDISDLLLNIREILRSEGLLENTAIILVDDNGYQNGEHLLDGKQKPYEESIRLPCFIEFHPWFSLGSRLDTILFQDIDLGKSILDMCNIHDSTYTAQSKGKSIHALEKAPHTSVYIEKPKWNLKEDETDSGPSFRAVRTVGRLYVRYHCRPDTVEELFNLTSDPLEDSNQINNPIYAAEKTYYRHLLDSLKVSLDDTLSKDTVYFPCKLLTTTSPRLSTESEVMSISISPNPSDGEIVIKTEGNEDAETEVRVYNCLGELVNRFILQAGSTKMKLFPGLYVCTLVSTHHTLSRKIIVQ